MHVFYPLKGLSLTFFKISLDLETLVDARPSIAVVADKKSGEGFFKEKEVLDSQEKVFIEVLENRLDLKEQSIFSRLQSSQNSQIPQNPQNLTNSTNSTETEQIDWSQ